MSDVDDQIVRSSVMLDRVYDQHRRGTGRSRNVTAIGKRLTRIALADAAILVAAVVIGWIMPLGIGGALLVMALLVVATLTLAIWPRETPPSEERLRTTDIKALPAQTERWLAAQRPALPAPALTLIDQIALRLDTLSPQLAQVGDDTEAAGEVRKLIGEQLPAFVTDYRKVPPALRSTPRNGRTPDAQLIDGLRLIEQEIGAMTAQLAQGDLDNLATRGRFLEIKYRGDGEG